MSRWLRVGWQSVISQEKIPWNAPPMAGDRTRTTRPRRGQTARYIHSPTWVSMTNRAILAAYFLAITAYKIEWQNKELTFLSFYSSLSSLSPHVIFVCGGTIIHQSFSYTLQSTRSCSLSPKLRPFCVTVRHLQNKSHIWVRPNEIHIQPKLHTL